MKLVDANIILRFLLDDTPAQAKASEHLFLTFGENLILTDLTFAEIIWVLSSVYDFNKEEIIEKVQSLFVVDIFKMNRNLLTRALEYYSLYNVAFVDAYLAAYCQDQNAEGIYSFDRGLDKIKTVKRFEPKIQKADSS